MEEVAVVSVNAAVAACAMRMAVGAEEAASAVVAAVAYVAVAASVESLCDGHQKLALTEETKAVIVPQTQ